MDRVRLVLALAAASPLVMAGCDPGGPASGDRRGEPVGDAPAAPVQLPQDPGVRSVYVPAYSHLSSGDREMMLAITLSVRNVDPFNTVTLRQVEYFDTSGHRVRQYLTSPRRLRPLETAEYSVETLDETGGSGANFLVHWEGPEHAQPLLTEAVMYGHVGTGYMSFTSRGVELVRAPEDEATPPEAQPALEATPP